MPDTRHEAALRAIASDNPREQEAGWQWFRWLRLRRPDHPQNITAPVTRALPEVRPGVFANTTDPAFLAALE